MYLPAAVTNRNSGGSESMCGANVRISSFYIQYAYVCTIVSSVIQRVIMARLDFESMMSVSSG